MKRNKKINYILTIALMLLLIINLPNKVYASEVTNEFTSLTIKTDVSDYDGDIAFTFTQDNGFNYNVLLTKSEKYTATIDIVGNVDYTAKATVKTNGEKYKIEGLDNKYKVSGKKVEINFKVSKSDLQVTENTNINTKSTSTIESNGKLLDNKTIYDNYIKAVSFIENNSDYTNFLKLYGNDIMKSYFLQADSLNTEDDWKKMSNFEKWNYYILYVRTKTLITGENSVKSEEELLKQLTSESSLLNNIKDGDKVIEAVKCVWKWEWEYWQKTGELANLYSEYKEGSAPKYSETELKDKDDNIEENKENENSLVNGLKRNIFSIIILAIAGITTTVIIVIRKKKNYDDIDEE